jgi:hypothetical protein
VPHFYIVDYAIDRYSIGDRPPGLVVADDGSITIRMSKDSPGPEPESNWLPAHVPPDRADVPAAPTSVRRHVRSARDSPRGLT